MTFGVSAMGMRPIALLNIVLSGVLSISNLVQTSLIQEAEIQSTHQVEGLLQPLNSSSERRGTQRRKGKGPERLNKTAWTSDGTGDFWEAPRRWLLAPCARMVFLSVFKRQLLVVLRTG